MRQNQISKRAKYNGFQGINLRKCHSGEENIYDIDNFRITTDGSLEKRHGFSHILSTENTISAMWGGFLDGKYSCFVIHGYSVCTLDIKTGILTEIGTINEAVGTPSFFFYRDSLYIFASPHFIKVTESSMYSVLGYVPHYAKDWGTTFAGEVNEPLNIFNGYAKLTYKVGNEYSILLSLGNTPLKSILSVYKNGELMAAEQYTKDPYYNAIRVPGIEPGDEYTAYVIFDLTEKQQELMSCTQQAVFGGINNCRLLMWGGQSNSIMYASAYVSRESLEAAEAEFPDCGAFYFPENHEFLVGDGGYGITAVGRHYDRLLIFTEGDAWMASSSACDIETIPAMSINSSVGCYSQKGCSSIGNSPITLWGRDVYCWTSDTDELNECNAYSISEPLGDALDRGLLKNAILFKSNAHQELWLHNKSFGSYVWIYNFECKAWYKFSNIRADGFFDADGDVGFYCGADIYCFSKDYYHDTHDNGNSYNIGAVVKFKNLHFGSGAKKRLSSCISCGDCGGTLHICLIPDIGSPIHTRVLLTQEHSITKKRLPPVRFSVLREVSIEALPQSNTRQVIHDFEIYARMP